MDNRLKMEKVLSYHFFCFVEECFCWADWHLQQFFSNLGYNYEGAHMKPICSSR